MKVKGKFYLKWMVVTVFFTIYDGGAEWIEMYWTLCWAEQCNITITMICKLWEDKCSFDRKKSFFFFYIHKQSQIYIQELEGNLFHMITKVLLSNQHQSFHYASLICLCPQPFVFVLRRRGIGFYLYLVCFHFIKYSGGELANPHLGWSRDWPAAPHYTASKGGNETSWKLLQYSEKALTFND